MASSSMHNHDSDTDVDSDLDDLINASTNDFPTTTTTTTTSRTALPLGLEGLELDELESLVLPPQSQRRRRCCVTTKGMALCTLLCYQITTKRPRLFFGVSTVLVLVLIVSLVNSAKSNIDPYQDAMIENDWSEVTSVFGLDIGKIDHWCIFGGNDKCSCDDPLEPISHAEQLGWMNAHKLNKKMILDALSNQHKHDDGFDMDENDDDSPSTTAKNDVDVAFLGDGTMEEWEGRWLGHESEAFQHTNSIFRKFFSKDHGGKYQGVSLGIAGDTTPNILWRIQHGELPPNFHPKVWWISMGANDLGRTGCSEEVVLMGILRIIEEIQLQRPKHTKIVVNAILPTNAKAKERLVQPPALGTKRDRHDDDGNSKKKKGGPNVNDGTVWYKSQTPKQRMPMLLESHIHRSRKEKDLMPSIRSINKELHKFCEKHEGVIYFDASEIIMKREDGDYKYGVDGLVVDPNMLRDGLHPNAIATKLWFQKIVKKLDKILIPEEEDTQQDQEEEEEEDED